VLRLRWLCLSRSRSLLLRLSLSQRLRLSSRRRSATSYSASTRHHDPSSLCPGRPESETISNKRVLHPRNGIIVLPVQGTRIREPDVVSPRGNPSFRPHHHLLWDWVQDVIVPWPVQEPYGRRIRRGSHFHPRLKIVMVHHITRATVAQRQNRLREAPDECTGVPAVGCAQAAGRAVLAHVPSKYSTRHPIPMASTRAMMCSWSASSPIGSTLRCR
jgi:hypothetical protein